MYLCPLKSQVTSSKPAGSFTILRFHFFNVSYGKILYNDKILKRWPVINMIYFDV